MRLIPSSPKPRTLSTALSIVSLAGNFDFSCSKMLGKSLFLTSLNALSNVFLSDFDSFLVSRI
mgnify:CR=1 FL=1